MKIKIIYFACTPDRQFYKKLSNGEYALEKAFNDVFKNSSDDYTCEWYCCDEKFGNNKLYQGSVSKTQKYTIKETRSSYKSLIDSIKFNDDTDYHIIAECSGCGSVVRNGLEVHSLDVFNDLIEKEKSNRIKSFTPLTSGFPEFIFNWHEGNMAYNSKYRSFIKVNQSQLGYIGWDNCASVPDREFKKQFEYIFKLVNKEKIKKPPRR